MRYKIYDQRINIIDNGDLFRKWCTAGDFSSSRCTSQKRRDLEMLPFYRPDVLAFLDLRSQLALESFQSEFYFFHEWVSYRVSRLIIRTIIARSRECKNFAEFHGVKIIYIEMRNKFRSINQKPIKLLAYLCKNKKLSCQSREKREKVLCVK